MKFTLAAVALAAMFVASPVLARDDGDVGMADDHCYRQCQKTGDCDCTDRFYGGGQKKTRDREGEACRNMNSDMRKHYRKCRQRDDEIQND